MIWNQTHVNSKMSPISCFPESVRYFFLFHFSTDNKHKKKQCNVITVKLKQTISSKALNADLTT